MVSEDKPFEYATLDDETQARVREKTKQIRGLARQTTRCLFEIGAHLAEARQMLGGRFGAWLAAEFQWSQRTAYNMIYVWSRFPNPDHFNLDAFSTSALYLLSAPQVPASVTEEALELANAGAEISYSAAKEMVESAAVGKSISPGGRPPRSMAREAPLALVHRLNGVINEISMEQCDTQLRSALRDLAVLILMKL